MKLPALPNSLLEFNPQVGLVLGSGLGYFAEDHIQIVDVLPYSAIEGFPISTVPGHVGRLIYGYLAGQRVLCMQGRFHYYEGYSMSQLTTPIRLMQALGVTTLFLTNAAGGINPSYNPGDFMLLSDHINFLGYNPLIGRNESNGPRFPDMSAVYDVDLREKIREWGQTTDHVLREGVYLATTGPSFETPAEIRAFAVWGADAVGMSTVPEAIVARQCGMRVVGISCITNAAAGLSQQPLSLAEITETADRVRPQFTALLNAAVELSGQL